MNKCIQNYWRCGSSSGGVIWVEKEEPDWCEAAISVKAAVLDYGDRLREGIRREERTIAQSEAIIDDLDYALQQLSAFIPTIQCTRKSYRCKTRMTSSGFSALRYYLEQGRAWFKHWS